MDRTEKKRLGLSLSVIKFTRNHVVQSKEETAVILSFWKKKKPDPFSRWLTCHLLPLFS